MDWKTNGPNLDFLLYFWGFIFLSFHASSSSWGRVVWAFQCARSVYSEIRLDRCPLEKLLAGVGRVAKDGKFFFKMGNIYY